MKHILIIFLLFALISLFMVADFANAQTADRPPVLDASAIETIHSYVISDANCWEQAPPPALKLQMKAFCGFDPAAHFTVRWQPPEQLSVQGQVSLLRAAEQLNKSYPKLNLYEANQFQEILEQIQPEIIGQMKKAANSALNLVKLTSFSTNEDFPMLNWFLYDPLDTVESGLADFETDPNADGASLVVTGISGGPWQGQQFKFFYSVDSPCVSRIEIRNSQISLKTDIVWQAMEKIQLPVRMEIYSESEILPEPVVIISEMAFQEIDGRWFPEKWFLQIPEMGETLYLEVLSAYSNPDFRGFPWEDKLVFVDEEKLARKIQADFQAKRDQLKRQ